MRFLDSLRSLEMGKVLVCQQSESEQWSSDFIFYKSSSITEDLE